MIWYIVIIQKLEKVMRNATTAILVHVDCGYGAFYKSFSDVLYCKTGLFRSYAKLYNNNVLIDGRSGGKESQQ